MTEKIVRVDSREIHCLSESLIHPISMWYSTSMYSIVLSLFFTPSSIAKFFGYRDDRNLGSFGKQRIDTRRDFCIARMNNSASFVLYTPLPVWICDLDIAQLNCRITTHQVDVILENNATWLNRSTGKVLSLCKPEVYCVVFLKFLS